MKKLIFIDTSYTLKEFENRKSLNVVFARDLLNYFDKVYNVHPLSDLTNKNISLNNIYYNSYQINNTHYFLEFITGANKTFSFLKSFSFIYYQVKMLIKLYYIIREENIDFIKTGDALYAGLVGLILSKITKKKLFVRIGSNNDKLRLEIKKPMQKKFFRFIFIEKYFETLVIKNAYHLFPANIDNGNYINSLYSCKNKSTVIRYGSLINDCHFIPPYKREIYSNIISETYNNNFKIIVCISRLEKEKLVLDVIDVFSRIHNHDKKIKLFIIGEGSQRNEIENFINIKGIFEHVILTGEKDQLWISQIISLSSLILSPHTGRALCEASLGGSIVVGYNIDWQSEIIKNNVDGILVEYKNKDQLYQMSKKVIQNVDNYKYLGNNLRNKAIELLDKKKSINDEIKVYKQINE